MGLPVITATMCQSLLGRWSSETMAEILYDTLNDTDAGVHGATG